MNGTINAPSWSGSTACAQPEPNRRETTTAAAAAPAAPAAADRNAKRGGVLGFHRRQGSGDLYTKLQHFEGGGGGGVRWPQPQQEKSGGPSSRYYYEVRGRGGSWGEFDDPLVCSESSGRVDEGSAAAVRSGEAAKRPTMPSEEEDSGGHGAGGGAGPPGGVSGLKEWYKNRALVSKATSKAEAPPKAKYLRKLVLSSWKHDGSGAPGILNMLCKRSLQSSAVVALKALITIHKLLQHGSPACRPACHSKLVLLNQVANGFRSAPSPQQPYSLLASAFASFLVEKVSFQHIFPAFERNYSVDLTASQQQRSPTSSGCVDASQHMPRAAVEALPYLQAIQDKILVALEEGLAMLRKSDAITLGGEMGGSGTSAVTECNPTELKVAMLIPVLREADLVYDICWFLLSSRLSSKEPGDHDDSTSTAPFQQMSRKLENQHRALRNCYERARSERVINCTVTLPNLPSDPPLRPMADLPVKGISSRYSLGSTLEQENGDKQCTLDQEPAAFLDRFTGTDEERPESRPLRERSLDDPAEDCAGGRDEGDDASPWGKHTSRQPSLAVGRFVAKREVSGPVVGGVGAAAAAAVQRFAAGQAEARRAAAAAAENAIAQHGAGIRNVRLEPPPRNQGLTAKLEFVRPERPQHTRGIGRTWSSFDDEAFLHKRPMGNPWSPLPNLASPKFYSPRAPGPSLDVTEFTLCTNCKSSSPLLFGLESPSQSGSKPMSPCPAPLEIFDAKPCRLVALQEDQPTESRGLSNCPILSPNFEHKRLERPETPPMIEMDTPVGEESLAGPAALPHQEVKSREQSATEKSGPPTTWQLEGSMSDAAGWTDLHHATANLGNGKAACRTTGTTESPPDISSAAAWEIPACELRFGPKIGQGAFGDVLKGTWQGTDVAIKRLQNSFGTSYSQAIEEIRHEVAVIMRLRHPNIILFMGACTIPPDICIVMEFAANGSLFGVLHNPNIAMDMVTVVRWATEAARGMNYLRTRNPPVVHRDLKSVNLLVDGDWHIKVSDFGLAMTKQSSYAYTQVGTWGWMAPEVLESAPYNEKADVYSFGVVLWELITREEPFKGYHPMQIMRAIDRGERPPIPESCPRLYRRLVSDCWHADPKCRPVFLEVLLRLGDIANTLNSLADHQRQLSSENCNCPLMF